MSVIAITLRTSAVVCALISLMSCGRSAAYYTEKGNTLFAHGEFSEAALNYRKAVQKDPADGEAYYRLGLTQRKQGNAGDAFQALSKALELSPDHQAARTEFANLVLPSYIADPHHPKRLYDLLMKLSDEWLKKDPHSLDGLRIKGYLAMEERRPEDAIELFRRADQSHPKEERITLGLMDALFRNKQPAEAETVGLNFIATEKTSGDVYDALYRLYLATNRRADAENILVRKVDTNPKEGAYILELAGHYARARKKTEMAAALQKFIANPAASRTVHLEAGDFYSAIGDWPTAIMQYNAGLKANQNDKLLYQNRIARALLSQNKRDEALKVLNNTVGQFPDDKEARSLRAALLVGTPGSDKAGAGIQEFQSVAEKNPDDLFLKFVFARAQLESGNLVGARTQLQEVVKKLPHFLEAHIELAQIAFRLGKMTEAVQHAEAGLEIDPGNFRAQLVRGKALLLLGNFEEAAAVLGRLSRQAPQSVDVRLELAKLDLAKRKYGEAEAAFKRISDSNPNDRRALAGLVDTDLAQSRQDKAFARLEQELKRSNGAPEVRNMLATTAERAGRYNLAIENLRQLAEGTPGSIAPHLQLAEVFRLKGDIPNAIATLQTAALLQPKDPRPASMLSLLLQMANRKQEAKLQCRRALSLWPDDVVSMNNLAFLLADTGDNLDEALKLARQAVDKMPGEPYFSDTLGFVYLKRDQTDDALAIFNNLVRQHPDNPNFAYHLGLVWFQKGQTSRAKTELTRALERGPSKEIETGANDLLKRINQL